MATGPQTESGSGESGATTEEESRLSRDRSTETAQTTDDSGSASETTARPDSGSGGTGAASGPSSGGGTDEQTGPGPGGDDGPQTASGGTSDDSDTQTDTGTDVTGPGPDEDGGPRTASGDPVEPDLSRTSDGRSTPDEPESTPVDPREVPGIARDLEQQAEEQTGRDVEAGEDFSIRRVGDRFVADFSGSFIADLSREAAEAAGRDLTAPPQDTRVGDGDGPALESGGVEVDLDLFDLGPGEAVPHRGSIDVGSLGSPGGDPRSDVLRDLEQQVGASRAEAAGISNPTLRQAVIDGVNLEPGEDVAFNTRQTAEGTVVTAELTEQFIREEAFANLQSATPGRELTEEDVILRVTDDGVEATVAPEDSDGIRDRLTDLDRQFAEAVGDAEETLLEVAGSEPFVGPAVTSPIGLAQVDPETTEPTVGEELVISSGAEAARFLSPAGIVLTTESAGRQVFGVEERVDIAQELADPSTDISEVPELGLRFATIPETTAENLEGITTTARSAPSAVATSFAQDPVQTTATGVGLAGALLLPSGAARGVGAAGRAARGARPAAAATAARVPRPSVSLPGPAVRIQRRPSSGPVVVDRSLFTSGAIRRDVVSPLGFAGDVASTIRRVPRRTASAAADRASSVAANLRTADANLAVSAFNLRQRAGRLPAQAELTAARAGERLSDLTSVPARARFQLEEAVAGGVRRDVVSPLAVAGDVGSAVRRVPRRTASAAADAAESVAMGIRTADANLAVSAFNLRRRAGMIPGRARLTAARTGERLSDLTSVPARARFQLEEAFAGAGTRRDVVSPFAVVGEPLSRAAGLPGRAASRARSLPGQAASRAQRELLGAEVSLSAVPPRLRDRVSNIFERVGEPTLVIGDPPAGPMVIRPGDIRSIEAPPVPSKLGTRTGSTLGFGERASRTQSGLSAVLRPRAQTATAAESTTSGQLVPAPLALVDTAPLAHPLASVDLDDFIASADQPSVSAPDGLDAEVTDLDDLVGESDLGAGEVELTASVEPGEASTPRSTQTPRVGPRDQQVPRTRVPGLTQLAQTPRNPPLPPGRPPRPPGRPPFLPPLDPRIGTSDRQTDSGLRLVDRTLHFEFRSPFDQLIDRTARFGFGAAADTGAPDPGGQEPTVGGILSLAGATGADPEPSEPAGVDPFGFLGAGPAGVPDTTGPAVPWASGGGAPAADDSIMELLGGGSSPSADNDDNQSPLEAIAGGFF